MVKSASLGRLKVGQVANVELNLDGKDKDRGPLCSS